MGRRRKRRTRSSRREPDRRGWPTQEHGIWTPMGGVEQFGNAVRVLRYTDRHVHASRALLVLIVAPVIAAVIAFVAFFGYDLLWGADGVLSR
ncbi:MAG: hypothetical protein M3R01_09225 [Actinomycetota bacterium]|nr:hypothetical protein [Actinomycetota bacterium]